jgi:putative ABC transport system permease protein
MSDRRSPSPLAERLLSIVLGDGEWTDSILGDLQEEFEIRADRSRHRARLWHAAQIVRLTVRGLAARVRRPRPVVPVLPQPPGDSLMRTLDVEFRYAVRSILRRPAMSAIVILTLGLGLGANAAVFSIVDALILRPFTIHDVDRVTLLSYTKPDDLDKRDSVTAADFLDWKKEKIDVFERFAAFDWWEANIVGRDEPEAVLGFRVSADFFPALGVQLTAGRSFRPEEEIFGQDRRVVIGHGLWQRRFASDPEIVGRAIEINGDKYEVIGIGPAGFDFPTGAQMWAPFAPDATVAANRRGDWLTAIGRLAPGRTLDDAKAQMAVIGERMSREHPDTNRDRKARVYTLSEGMTDAGVGPVLAMWQASALFVLLIACANVANLLLARGAERQREMAVRLAIGASRIRIVREMLLESIVLGLVAVPMAIFLAWGFLKLLVQFMPAKIARFVAGWYEIDVDGRMIFFTIAIGLGAAVIFGLVPALQGSRPRLAESLKDGGRTAAGGVSRLRLRRSLVVGEMALALPLLVASALSVVTVHRFLNGPQGYDADRLLTMRAILSGGRYETPESRRRFAIDAIDKLAALPGAQSAAAINIIPAQGGNWGTSLEIEGVPSDDPNNPPSSDYRTATEGIFATLGVPILKGRAFSDADREGSLPVAIVTESFARRFWPNADPIGKRLKAGNSDWLTVVGVCGDVIHDWFGRRNYPTMYRALRQAPPASVALVVRTPRDPKLLLGDARAALRAVDPAQPLFDLRTMREGLGERTIGLQYIGAIMLVFGGLALVLALIGVYGVMAHMVTQRTHEIGVRMALGATERDVIRLTIGQTGLLTAIGVALGVLLSIALNGAMQAGLLAASSDARIVAGLAVLLSGAALAAGYIPARRAAAIEPTVALRGE